MVVLISYYFPPELSAGSYRALDFSRAISDNKINLLVITAKEYRYKQAINYNSINELGTKIDIIRIYVPFKGGGLFKGIINFISFSIFTIINLINLKPNYIISTSGRLGTNLLAFFISKYKKCKIALDIRDVFSINLRRLIFSKYKRIGCLLFFIFLKIEKFIYSRADFVNVVSPYFKKIYGKLKFQTQNWTSFSNGIDIQFIKNISNNFKNISHNKKINILYAGNLGDGQKIDYFLTDFSKNLPKNSHFIIIGNGNRRRIIQNLIEKKKLNNVTLKNAIPRIELKKFYDEADILLISLGPETCLSYVIPSKVFEYGTFNKPILVGAKGFTAKFIKKELPLVSIFSPGDGLNAVKSYNNIIDSKHSKKKLNDLDKKRDIFINKYRRDVITNQLIELIFNTK